METEETDNRGEKSRYFYQRKEYEVESFGKINVDKHLF